MTFTIKETEDHTFTAITDVPRIHDGATDKYRPVTQEDVDRLLRHQVLLMDVLRMLRQHVGHELEISTHPGPFIETELKDKLSALYRMAENTRTK